MGWFMDNNRKPSESIWSNSSIQSGCPRCCHLSREVQLHSGNWYPVTGLKSISLTTAVLLEWWSQLVFTWQGWQRTFKGRSKRFCIMLEQKITVLRVERQEDHKFKMSLCKMQREKLSQKRTKITTAKLSLVITIYRLHTLVMNGHEFKKIHVCSLTVLESKGPKSLHCITSRLWAMLKAILPLEDLGNWWTPSTPGETPIIFTLLGSFNFTVLSSFKRIPLYIRNQSW